MLRRKLITLALALCSAISVMAQQSGDVVGVEDFHAIDIRGNVHMIICQSQNSSTLTVEYNNIGQNQFKYKVRKGVLYIDVPSGLLDGQGFARVAITTPRLEKIEVEGATVECLTPIKGEYLEFISNGSINLATLNVEVNRLSITTAGKSDVMVIGSAADVNFRATFGSRIDAFALKTQTAVAKCYDGSEIYVCPVLSLKATASTAGSIYYKNTAIVEPKVSLWGDVVLIERAQYKPLFVATPQPAPSTTQTAQADEPAKPPVAKPAAEKVDKQPSPRKVEKRSPKKKPQPQQTKESTGSDGDFF